MISYIHAGDNFPSLPMKLQQKLEDMLETYGRKRPLLPKLLPHDDTCYLLEFHTDNCDHCIQMEPVLRRLEDDLDTKIFRINVGHKREFVDLLQFIGHDEFGGFPFYYNRRTCQAIGGATAYANLKKWAVGDTNHLFQDPPENIYDLDQDFSNRREIGAKGMLMEKLMKVGKKGEKKKKES